VTRPDRSIDAGGARFDAMLLQTTIVKLGASSRAPRLNRRAPNSREAVVMHAALVLILYTGTSAFAAASPTEPSQPKPITIGDVPPAFSLTHWIPKKPPVLPGPQVDGEEHIFVINFWSAWDENSRAHQAMFAQIAARFADDRVTVMCLSNDDASELSQFAAAHKGMTQYFGCDGENTTTERWLVGVEQFPWSFVIARDGRIAWAGQSIWALRAAVQQLVENRYDLGAARSRSGELVGVEPLQMAVAQAMRQRDLDEALRLSDKIIALDPLRLDGYEFKRLLIIRFKDLDDDEAARMAALYEQMRAAFWNEPTGLHELVEWNWQDRTMAMRDPAVMVRCAQRMVDLSGGSDPFALAELARVRFELGQLDAAIAAQEKAVELIRVDLDGEMAQTLAYYQRVKQAAAAHAAAEAAAPPASAPASAPSR
jgi:tetratricopeptide (TPR) repeat protein